MGPLYSVFGMMARLKERNPCSKHTVGVYIGDSFCLDVGSYCSVHSFSDIP